MPNFVKSTDPSPKLKNLNAMSNEEIAFVRMDAVNTADALVQRYRSKGPEFLKLVASFLRERADKLISNRKQEGAA